MILLKWLFIFLLVGANGFFVAAEFALVKIRMGEVNLLVEEKIRGARLTKSILANLDSYLSACQLGITFASLGLGWIGEPLIARQLSPILHNFGASDHAIHAISFAVAFTVITFLHITIGEQVPKIYAIQRYQKTSLAIGLPLLAFYKLFKPFIWLLNVSSNYMLKAVGVGDTSDHGGVQSEAELRMLMRESSEGGHVTRDEVKLMANVLDLEDKVARVYMTPRHEVVFLRVDESLEASLSKAAASGHTRFPLCEGDLDKALGIINVKDIFATEHSGSQVTSLADIARPVVFVSEVTRLDVLLSRFLKEKSHMFILVDEFGATCGIITLENVLEEVVGQIQDEFDAEAPNLTELPGRDCEADGSCALKKVMQLTGLQFKEEETDTIGGLVVQALGRIPAAGEELMLGAHRIKILNADDRRVLRVRVEALEPTDASSE